MNSSVNASVNASAPVLTRNSLMTLAFQRLCWKECRQIAPLAIALLSISFLMHLLTISLDASALADIHRLSLLLFPCLFAIGAGALLVSLEKEQRTMGWLSSLPIAPQQILLSKLIVGLTGLAIVWCVCLLIALCFNYKLFLPTAFDGNAFPLSLTVVNSIFLLCLGLATAWRWQTPLAALAMIVPLGALPTFAIIATQSLSPENRISDFSSCLIYILLSGAFVWYGWRSGQSFLKSKPRSRIGQNLSVTFERQGSRGNLLSAQPQGLASTLLWQFSVQNRMLLIAVVATILLPLIAYVFPVSLKDNPIIPIAAWLIFSWLGAAVFQSDSVHQRIKFLAERGIAPRTIWWTRQVFPLSLALIATAIAALLTRNVLANIYPQQLSNHPLLLLGLPVVLMVHAAAQWLGQLVRSPIVSLILAPAVTLGAIGYSVFAVFGMGAPFWMVLIPIGIAFVATRVMTQPWMDDRTGPKYWLGHGGFLLAATGIPAIPLLITAMTYPGMPSSAHQSFEAESRKYGGFSNPIELVLPPKQMFVPEHDDSAGMAVDTTDEIGEAALGDFDLSGGVGEMLGINPGTGLAGEVTLKPEPALGFVEQMKQDVATIELQLTSRSGAVRWSQAVSFLAAEAMLTRAHLDIEPTNESSRDRYRTAMELLNEVASRLRLSWRLVDQDFADRLERWMIEQVQLKDARETLGESNWNAITKAVTDKARRTAARRRAIIMSWKHATIADGQLELGGVQLANNSGLIGWRGQIADRRRVDRVSWLLLRYLESKDQSEADARFAEVATAWGLNASRSRNFGLSLEVGLQIPGQNWLGEWDEF